MKQEIMADTYPDRTLDDSSSSDESEIRPDSEGWEDAEPDEEVVQIKDFFSDTTFPDALSMIEYCSHHHGLDFLSTQQRLGVYVLFHKFCGGNIMQTDLPLRP